MGPVGLDLVGRRVLVAGGSSGIGRTVVEEAAGAGAEVIAVGRRQALLDEVAAGHDRVTAVVADLRRPDACRRVVDEAATGRGLDAVVLALGVSTLTPLEAAGAETWSDVLTTNAVAPALVTRAAVPHLTVDGVVAFLSSEAVGRPRHGMIPYGASKAALDALVQGWRLEHPGHRFLRFVVGSTTGTDFARDFDPEVMTRCFDAWLAAGITVEHLMACADVGRAIVEIVAVALAHPGVDVRDVSLMPPADC